MTPKYALLSAFLVVFASPALAQSKSSKSAEQMGTAEQRAACRADVRRFCRSVNPDEGEMAYYYCLLNNQTKLRPQCAEVVGVAKR
jgi:hypothetical protein